MNGDRAYLEHIQEAIRRVMEYTATGREDFFARTLLQDGVIRNLEIIGEATKKLSPELRSRRFLTRFFCLTDAAIIV